MPRILLPIFSSFDHLSFLRWWTNEVAPFFGCTNQLKFSMRLWIAGFYLNYLSISHYSVQSNEMKKKKEKKNCCVTSSETDSMIKEAIYGNWHSFWFIAIQSIQAVTLLDCLRHTYTKKNHVYVHQSNLFRIFYACKTDIIFLERNLMDIFLSMTVCHS